MIVDDILCNSGISKYNSKIQGDRNIIPTLIRALKLYGPNDVNNSLIRPPPYNLLKEVSKRCRIFALFLEL